jgi:MFS family permease
LIAPPLLIVGLALGGGGYGLSTRHIAGLAVWLVVVALLALGAASRAALGRPFYWASGLIGGLALLSAISSLWSGSIELSVIEADRVLVYLGFFLAAFLIAQTDQRRQRFAEGIAISLALVAFLALASRLLPHVIELPITSETGPRTRYPLGYWNAVGASCGFATAMLLWGSRRSLSRWLRWFAVAALPATMLALYFTYSRGGVLALLIACGCLIALSHDRLWLLATLAIGAIGALPAVLAAQARQSLADNIADQTAANQGLTVLLILLAGTALTLLLFAGLRRLEDRDGGAAGRAVELSRSPVVLKRLALVAALLGIAAAVAVGGRAWNQFSNSDVAFPSQPQQHFNNLSGAGRHDFYRVAVDAFGEAPLLGHGAGTYVFSWEKLRSIDQPVHDAHSLYLQAFAELGLVGGLLVLALVGILLGAGFLAWRDSGGPRRELHAALFAVVLSFAIGAAIDWFWEIAAMGAIFFLASGALVAARCAQLARARAASGERQEQRRFGFAVAGLAIAWISAVALVGPLLVNRELNSAESASAQGDLVAAVDRAETARSIEPWAASPYVVLGLLAEVKGEYAAAAKLLTQAIEREEHSWKLFFLRSRVEREAGNTAAARADFEQASSLNPRAPQLDLGYAR